MVCVRHASSGPHKRSTLAPPCSQSGKQEHQGSEREVGRLQHVEVDIHHLHRFEGHDQRTGATGERHSEIVPPVRQHCARKRNQPDYLPLLEQEILQVIRKYVDIDQDQISVQLDHSDDCSVLELNVTLPERR